MNTDERRAEAIEKGAEIMQEMAPDVEWAPGYLDKVVAAVLDASGLLDERGDRMEDRSRKLSGEHALISNTRQRQWDYATYVRNYDDLMEKAQALLDQLVAQDAEWEQVAAPVVLVDGSWLPCKAKDKLFRRRDAEGTP